jgi:hypothetical protein
MKTIAIASILDSGSALELGERSQTQKMVGALSAQKRMAKACTNATLRINSKSLAWSAKIMAN